LEEGLLRAAAADVAFDGRIAAIEAAVDRPPNVVNVNVTPGTKVEVTNQVPAPKIDVHVPSAPPTPVEVTNQVHVAPTPPTPVKVTNQVNVPPAPPTPVHVEVKAAEGTQKMEIVGPVEIAVREAPDATEVTDVERGSDYKILRTTRTVHHKKKGE
jgi:hypothetical protein